MATTAVERAVSGGVSTARQSTAEPPRTVTRIIEDYLGEDKVSCDLLFIWELTGGSGHGHVPSEQKHRTEYFKQVRKHLMKTYGLSNEELSQLIQIYRERNTGPQRTAKRLRERTIQ